VNPAPAFQCYSREWLSKTAILSLSGRGALWTLMMWSWDNGPLPSSVPAIARLAHENFRRFSPVWREIRRLWKKTGRGFVLVELEILRRKQLTYRKLQRRKALASVEKRKRRLASAEPEARHQPGTSSSSSSSDLDQNQDQTQRRGGAARFRARTQNDRALYLLVKTVMQETPSLEWSSESKHRAARAGLVFTADTINRCIDSAMVILERERRKA
jgi:uncharacterized protein YdaU (DUF1376 family)